MRALPSTPRRGSPRSSGSTCGSTSVRSRHGIRSRSGSRTPGRCSVRSALRSRNSASSDAAVRTGPDGVDEGTPRAGCSRLVDLRGAHAVGGARRDLPDEAIRTAGGVRRIRVLALPPRAPIDECAQFVRVVAERLELPSATHPGDTARPDDVHRHPAIAGCDIAACVSLLRHRSSRRRRPTRCGRRRPPPSPHRTPAARSARSLRRTPRSRRCARACRR